MCFRVTNYRCIRCTLPLCNLCSVAELDDGTCGWIAGKQVGYCKDCDDDSQSRGKQKVAIHNVNGAVKNKRLKWYVFMWAFDCLDHYLP